MKFSFSSISKKYDPLQSETYKAIQEEENDLLDVSPIAPKVFTPPGPRHQPQPKVSNYHRDHAQAVKVFAIKYIKKQLEQSANSDGYTKINLFK